MAAKRFGLDNLPADGWAQYVRTTPTRMKRIEGPFEVETPHGLAYCEDGWLAIDANGDPYPVAAEIHTATYAELK